MTNTMLPGRYDLIMQSPTGVELGKVASYHSSEMGGTVGSVNTDPLKRPKLPVSNFAIGQDFYFLIRFTPDSTTTEHSTSGTGVATFQIPFRMMDLATKTVYRNNFTTLAAGTSGYPSEFTFSNLRPYANNQIWTAGVAYDIYKWKMPAGVVIKLGVLPIHAGDYVASTIYMQRDVVTS
jgi:hypothetical protein